MAEEKINTLDGVQVDFVEEIDGQLIRKSISVKDFLKGMDEGKIQLSTREVKFYNVLKQLYEMNNREPPLFKSFPKRKDGKKLIIDASTLEYNEQGFTAALFVPQMNKIKFKNAQSAKNLLTTLAHELKHAEQNSDEVRDVSLQTKDGLAHHQIRYLKEAQAYAFGSFIENLQKNKDLNWEAYQTKTIPLYLKILNEKTPYKNSYDSIASIDVRNDKGIDLSGPILDAFHFPKELKDKIPEELNKVKSREEKYIMISEKILKFLPNLPIENIKKINFENLLPFALNRLNNKLISDEISKEKYGDLLQKVIKLGVNVNFPDKNGRTTLMTAAEKGTVESVSALIEAGSERELFDNKGMNALMLAVQSENVEVVKELIFVDLYNGIEFMYESLDETLDIMDIARKTGNKEIINILENTKKKVKENEAGLLKGDPKAFEEIQKWREARNKKYPSLEHENDDFDLEGGNRRSRIKDENPLQELQLESKKEPKKSFISKIASIFKPKKISEPQKNKSLFDATNQLIDGKKNAIKSVSMALPRQSMDNKQTSKLAHTPSKVDEKVASVQKDSSR